MIDFCQGENHPAASCQPTGSCGVVPWINWTSLRNCGIFNWQPRSQLNKLVTGFTEFRQVDKDGRIFHWSVQSPTSTKEASHFSHFRVVYIMIS